MAGFVSSQQIEPLAYDFEEHGPSGVTPEPTQGTLTRFLGRLKEVTGDVGIESPDELAAALDTFDEAKLEEVNGQMVDAVADLCQGHPTRDEIVALPVRIQQAWTGWLLGQLTDPTRPSSVS